MTRPRPNSTAESIKKKNVRESKLTLSKIKPTKSTITYKDIQSNSAVNSKCNAVLTFSTMVKKNIKNSIRTRFKSPNIIYYVSIISLELSLRLPIPL